MNPIRRYLVAAVGGVAALGLWGGLGSAATAAKPSNRTPPSITGAAVVGSVLTGHLGTWTGNPTDINTWWRRCGAGGHNCSNINGSDGHLTYRVGAADEGHRLRFSVGAANGYGRTWKPSAPTAVVPAAAPGCPATKGSDDVAAISSPARLSLDGIQAPSIVVKETKTLVLRFHVSSTCGGSVSGALVYVTATPFFQFTVPPEAVTGADGWAEVQMQRLAGFPVSSRQQLLALFVRARKPGEDPLAGISTRRLFSVRVDLHA